MKLRLDNDDFGNASVKMRTVLPTEWELWFQLHARLWLFEIVGRCTRETSLCSTLNFWWFCKIYERWFWECIHEIEFQEKCIEWIWLLCLCDGHWTHVIAELCGVQCKSVCQANWPLCKKTHLYSVVSPIQGNRSRCLQFILGLCEAWRSKTNEDVSESLNVIWGHLSLLAVLMNLLIVRRMAIVFVFSINESYFLSMMQEVFVWIYLRFTEEMQPLTSD